MKVKIQEAMDSLGVALKDLLSEWFIWLPVMAAFFLIGLYLS